MPSPEGFESANENEREPDRSAPLFPMPELLEFPEELRFGYEHLLINPATGKPYTDEELAREDRLWPTTDHSQDGDSPETDPPHPAS